MLDKNYNGLRGWDLKIGVPKRKNLRCLIWKGHRPNKKDHKQLNMGEITDMDYQNLLSLVKERRSSRRFKPDPIPDDMIHKIIEVARWAPSGANSQPWDFIVVREKELRQEIVQYYKDFLSLYYKIEHTRVYNLGEAPLFLLAIQVHWWHILKAVCNETAANKT